MRKLPFLVGAAVLLVAAKFVFVERTPGTRTMPAAPAPGTDVYGDPLPPFAIARIGSVRFRGASFGLAWTDGGTALVSCGEDGVVRVFDAETGLVRREFVAHSGTVEQGGAARSPIESARRLLKGKIFPVHDRPCSAAVSDDGARIVTAGPAAVSVWDVATGSRVATWTAPKRRAEVVTISGDGRVVAQGGDDQRVEVRYAETGERIAVIRPKDHTDDDDESVTSIALSRDGSLVAYGATSVYLADAATGRQIGVGSGQTWDSAGLSPAGDVFVQTKFRGNLIVRDAATFEERRTVELPREHDGWTRTAFSADGRRLAVGDSFLRVIDPAEGTVLTELLGNDTFVTGLAWTADRRRLAAVCAGVVRVWDTESWTELHPPPAPVGSCRDFVTSADGRTIAIAAGARRIDLFDANSGAARTSITLPDGVMSFQSFDLSPAADVVATWSHVQGLTVHRWDAADGHEVSRTVVPHAVGILWSRPPLLKGHDDGGQFIVDPWSGEIAFRLTGPQIDAAGGINNQVRFTPDGQFAVATASDGTAATVWDRATAKTVAAYAIPVRAHGVAEFSGDSTRMALVDGTRVAVVDVVIGTRAGTFDVLENDWAGTVALSHDGRVAATAGADGAVLLRDVATGDVVATLHGHRAPVRHLVFSDGGRTLTTGADSVIVWDVAAWTR